MLLLPLNVHPTPAPARSTQSSGEGGGKKIPPKQCGTNRSGHAVRCLIHELISWGTSLLQVPKKKWSEWKWSLGKAFVGHGGHFPRPGGGGGLAF